LENEVAVKEEEKEALEAKLADPDFYQQAEAFRETMRAFGEVEAELKELMQRWEAAARSSKPPERRRSGRYAGRLDVRDQRLEDGRAVGIAQQRLDAAPRVPHTPEHVARLVRDAGDVARRAVRVGPRRGLAGRRRVAEDDLAVRLEAVERLVVGVVVALAVG